MIVILTIELQACTINSVYKPPGNPFSFQIPTNYHNKDTKIIIGDFNCHNTSWDYVETDDDGEKFENWTDHSNLKLIHDPQLPTSFNSGRRKRSYNSDSISVSERIAKQAIKKIEGPIPRMQHRLITCCVMAVVKPNIMPFKRRFNF
jgi:hypothetical protein